MAATSPKYLSRPANFVIRPAPGWVDLTGEELTEITAKPFGKYKFVPEFKADKGAIHAANVDFRQALDWCMRLRTAHDVEWLAWEGKCGSWRDLGKACESLKGLGFLPEGPLGPDGAKGTEVTGVHVTVKANTSFVVTSGTIREKFIELLGVKQTEDAALRFRLDLYRDRLRVLVSLAGEPLYKRGYKKHLTSAAAPLPEHQAAGCIRTTLVTLAADSSADLKKAAQKISFDGVYVPFAGTGTLAFEWLAAHLDIGSGSFGRHYAFESFAGIPGTTIAHIRKKMSEVRGAPRDASVAAPAALLPVLCIERNAEALSDLRDNAVHFCDLAGIDSKAIEVAAGDFFKSDSETALRAMARSGRSILMLLNPPYGQRLKAPAEAKKYFARIASHIVDLEVRTGASFSGMCLIPEEPASAAFVKSLKGTHKTTTVHFTHGGSDIRLVVFGPA